MKKILLLGLMGLMGLSGSRAHGQMIIDMWNMTTGVDTTLWYDIDGVDSVIITAGDKTSAQSGLVNIGFPFTLGESTYSQFSTNINGTVRLGSTQLSANGSYSNALNQNNGPKIEPFGYRGRFDNNCYTRMALLGTAGNRVLVVETRMKDYSYFSDSLYVSFQVQLFEAGGLRVVYGEADSGAVYTTTSARLQNGVSAGVNSNNKDIIFIDFATHEAVRLNASCSLHNAAAAWPEKGRWYNLFYDSTLCPYPPAVSTTGNNPADITLTCANGVSDLHILIPAVGIDTVWPGTESYLSLGIAFNPTTTYNGTVQSICANGRTSYRTRAFSFSTGCGVVHYLPWSADFQTAAATNCWDATRYTATGNRWRHANYNMSCAGGGLQTYDEWLVSPAFVLPDSDGITLQWNYKTTMINGIAPTVDVRVALCAADGTVDSTAWVTLRTINTHMSSYTTLYNSLDAYRGQRIKVAYVRYGVGGGTAYLDNFSVNLHPIPSMTLEAPTYTRVGDTTVFAANMIAGCERDIVWTWHSTLMDSTFIGSNEAHMVYTVPGTDTVTVILSNNYGSDTATAVVWVANCHTVASFPWVEGFSSYDYLACWIVNGWQMTTNCLGHDEDGNSRIYWNLASSNTEGSYMLSPAITLPSTGMHNMKLWVEGSRPMMVRLSSTASTDTADYNDTLLVVNSNSTPIDMWWHMVDLEPYAGQTVRIGFFKMAGGQSFINEIKIDYDTLPKLFAIDGQSRTMVDSSTLFTVSLRRGSTDGLHYTWSSSRGGIISTNAICDSMTVIYPSGSGNLVDTITVVATNAYGSDTVSKMLRVVDCTPATSLPWTEDFQDGDVCWYKPEGSKWYDAIPNGMASQEHLRHLYLQARTDTLGSWIMSKEIQIPADTTLATRLFWNVASSNNTYQHLYSVLVTTAQDYTDTANYTVLYTDNSTHVNFSNYDIRSVDLSPYAGQSIHVAFHNHAWHLAPSATGLYIDNVEIRPAPVPVVSLSAPNPTNSHEPVTFTANLIEGSSTGLTYTWHSTLMDSTTVTTAPVLTMTYTAGGTDTMMVIASNAYGADSATVVVQVIDCTPITLPWLENFDALIGTNYSTEGPLPDCWRSYWNGTNAAYAPHVIGAYPYNPVSGYFTSGQQALLLMAGTSSGWDSVAIVESPKVAGGLNGKRLSFYYQHESANYGQLSVGYMQDSVFVSVADLPQQQTGQTVNLRLDSIPASVNRFALQWKKVGTWYGVIIDNVELSESDSVPTVAIATPQRVGGDSILFRAYLIDGLPDSLTYSWHSTMAVAGQAILTATGDSAYIVYTAVGSDTVSVIATNAYGIDTAWVQYTYMGAPVAAITGPSSVLTDDTNTYAAYLLTGSTTGISYSWQSTMAAAGQATMLVTGDTLRMVYLTGGTDTLTLITTNAFGVDTTRRIITVTNCHITTFPWTEGFENGMNSCWYLSTIPGSTTTNWSIRGEYWYAHSGSHYMYSPFATADGDNSSIDAWFILPPVEVPASSSLSLNFYANFQGNSTTHSYPRLTVLVSTLGNATNYFTDTIYSEQTNTLDREYLFGSASLAAYADQTVWIAFVHGNRNVSLGIDDISIDYSAVPVAAISGPTEQLSSEEAIFTAHLLNGDTTGITYIWHSTMADAGLATLTATDSTAAIEYHAGGTDHVSVVIANAAGSDSVAMTCSVTNCEPIIQLPYTVRLNSNNNITCWQKESGWYIGDYFSSGITCMQCLNWDFDPVDNWLVMREIAIPADYTQSYTLRWHMQCNHSKYQVMVSTQGRSSHSLFDTLYYEHSDSTQWTSRTLSLDAYRGQNIYIAFRNLGWYNSPAHYADYGVFRIDTIQVLVSSDTQTYRTLTLDVNDSTMGTVSGAGVYPDSSVVTLSANPFGGYHFVAWNDGDTHVVRNILLVSDTAFTAHFAADTLPTPPTPDTLWRTVTVHMLLDSGDTLFEADVVSVTGAGSYPDSTLVTLTAYYDNYYPYFWYWVTPANDTLYDNPYSFVVTSDTVINAIFGPMCVGIDGTEGAAPDVAIHPNPATGDAYVSVGVPSTVTVVDLQGRTVLQPTRVASTLCIQQGTLPKGIYFVSVSNSVGTVVKKLVIQ